jgi:hypothetical protein
MWATGVVPPMTAFSDSKALPLRPGVGLQGGGFGFFVELDRPGERQAGRWLARRRRQYWGQVGQRLRQYDPKVSERLQCIEHGLVVLRRAVGADSCGAKRGRVHVHLIGTRGTLLSPSHDVVHARRLRHRSTPQFREDLSAAQRQRLGVDLGYARVPSPQAGLNESPAHGGLQIQGDRPIGGSSRRRWGRG